MRDSHGRVLWIVLVINAEMFFVEGTAGLFAHSTSLLADALDMHRRRAGTGCQLCNDDVIPALPSI